MVKKAKKTPIIYNFELFGFFSIIWHDDCCSRCMIDGLFASSNYQGVKRMLDATVLRQEAIASNLANLETPHYKRVDVSPTFASELSQAISSGSPAALSGLKPTISVDQNAVAQSRDGNSVQLEKEMIYLQRNMVAHHLQTQMLSGTFSKLHTAIRGR